MNRMLLIIVSLSGILLTTVGVDVNINSIFGSQFCTVHINCTFSADSQETLNSVDIQRSSGSSFTTVASCNLNNFTASTFDAALSTTGSSGMSLECRRGFFSVAINSIAVTDSTEVKCQIASLDNVTEETASISVTKPISNCTNMSCQATGQRCVDGCGGLQCVPVESCSDCLIATTERISSQNTDCDTVVPLANVTTVWLGSPLQLICTSNSSSPPVSITWSRDSDKSSTSNIIPSSHGNLTIMSSVPSTGGNYYCHVTDTVCTSQTETLVIVYWENPVNSSNAQDDKKTEGDSLDLTCNVTTRPLPSVAFYFINSQAVSQLSSTAVSAKTTLAIGSKLSSAQSKPGWAELHVTSLGLNDSGRYSCIAQLPGDLYYTILTHDITVIEDTSSDNSATTASSSNSEKSLFPLWQIGVFVIGADALLIFTIVTCVVCKLKCDGKDNETAPLDTEEEPGDVKEPDFSEKDDEPLTPPSTNTRSRNQPDRYNDEDDEAALSKRTGVRLPPLERQGNKPIVLVTNENENDDQLEPRNGAVNGRRPMQLTSSQ